ncbi:hypothetical protein B0T25DRAFT_159213 [Lasiosphaeria hispida]|uniref:Uncharacterized protein n=1 Tax=Lasiosphaeria hispida TaxID=260671 RepID=A0AAJ0MG65_9PEZI|nr:hypothetical protein B0T25DRAFT_159213 [Lasiosphaeria hispida]
MRVGPVFGTIHVAIDAAVGVAVACVCGKARVERDQLIAVGVSVDGAVTQRTEKASRTFKKYAEISSKVWGNGAMGGFDDFWRARRARGRVPTRGDLGAWQSVGAGTLSEARQEVPKEVVDMGRGTTRFVTEWRYPMDALGHETLILFPVPSGLMEGGRTVPWGFPVVPSWHP